MEKTSFYSNMIRPSIFFFRLIFETFLEVYKSYIEWKSPCFHFFCYRQGLRIIECKVRIKITELKLKSKSVKVVIKISSFQNYRFLVVEFCWLISCCFILG